MNLTPLKIIGKEAYLCIKGPSRLSKDPRPKRGPNTLWRGKSKDVKDFMKVENGSVHRKKYDGHCGK